MADEKQHLATWEDILADADFVYDMTMVFKVPQINPKTGQKPNAPLLTGPEVVERFQKAGLKTKLYQSIGQDEVYCLIGASESRLELEADRINMDMLFDANRAAECAKNRGIRLAMAFDEKDSVSHELIDTSIWSNLYGQFSRNPAKQALYTKYVKEDGRSSVFRTADRIKLIVSIIEAPDTVRGAGLSIDKLKKLENTHVLSFFPLHEPSRLHELKNRWLTATKVVNQPIDDIRAYFGEKVGLYFAFLQFYWWALLVPSVFGALWFGLQKYYGAGVKTRGLYVFAFILVAWATLFLEGWKNRQAIYRMKWGMTDFNEKEQPRPEFYGDLVRSPVDGKVVEYFPFWKKVWKVIVSQSVVITLIAAVIASVVGVFILRFIITNSTADQTLASVYGALINVVVIQFFNFVYGKVGEKLNDYENHRTDSEFENALIAKSFMFRFVNSYNSLFYVAFFKQLTTGCTDPTGTNVLTNGYPCMEDLSTQLFIVFGTMIVVNNLTELGVPLLKSVFAGRKEQGKSDAQKSVPEMEYELADCESTFADYDELSVQFGFVTMFTVAFPLAPVFALVNNYIEVFIDGEKYVKVSKRPEPRGTYDVGTWLDIFTLISWVALFTNTLLVVAYTDELRNWVGAVNFSTTQSVSNSLDATQLFKLAIIFVATEHVLGILKYLISYFVPDEPPFVAEHILRQRYLVSVLVLDGAEENDDEFLVAAEKAPDGRQLEFDLNTVATKLDNDGHTRKTLVAGDVHAASNTVEMQASPA